MTAINVARALFASCLVCLSACVHCGSTSSEDPGISSVIVSHRATDGSPSGTLFVYPSSDTYRFLGGESAGPREEKPLPGDVKSKLYPVLTGDLWHHYQSVSNGDQSCYDQGYVLDGTSVDGKAGGIGCWLPASVTDEKTKTMLETVIPLFEMLSGARAADAG